MEMERINEDIIRVVVTNDDLAERSMTVIDLLGNQEEIENFFYSILEEVDITQDFKNNEAVTFQVLPNKNGLELFISKNANDKEMMKGMFASMFGQPDASDINDDVSDALLAQLLDHDDDKPAPRASKVERNNNEKEVDELLNDNRNPGNLHAVIKQLIMKFNDFENIILFAKGNPEVPAQTTLYQLGDKYYLVFDFNETIGRPGVQDLTAIAREYGEVAPIATEVLMEHGKAVFEQNAVQKVNELF